MRLRLPVLTQEEVLVLVVVGQVFQLLLAVLRRRETEERDRECWHLHLGPSLPCPSPPALQPPLSLLLGASVPRVSICPLRPLGPAPG